MSQSLVKNYVHLVDSTKHRQLWIPKEHQAELYKYQSGIFDNWESPAIVIGGIEDHVHALFSLQKNHALKKVVAAVKTGRSKWMKDEGPKNPDFYWQLGYAPFSVSQSNVDAVVNDIQNQEEHHKRSTFKDELRALLRKHEIELDERYVWDESP